MNKSILAVKNFFILTLLSVLIVSCSDDDINISCTDPLTGELTELETEFSGKWILGSIVADQEIDLTDDETDNPSKDLYAQYDECVQDAVYNFNSDRAYAFEQGMHFGDCEEENRTNGTWKLENDYILTIVSNCNSATTALELNEDITEFSVENSMTFSDVNGKIIKLLTVTTYTKS
ncbi:DUF5004 domain-containing protein [Tamlana haliotis]|uniref:DUF5004 domain-containing protein n=1 Tax=Pseudotamlana haliotis TaxID=2614804 RepID=A0A6N6MH31_9FLAO|nr:DUF5004 domain-containing protein [Tamlana haliotis]KAB1069184.1 DUF5004 domain-containing protein [Tamlana haliotis]